LKMNSLFKNLQVKLMLIFFGFALAPPLAVGLFSINTAEQLILSMARNQIDHIAADKAALLERWISERKSDLDVIAGSSILGSLDSRQIGEFLELVRAKYMVYGEFSVVSRDGGIVYSSSGRTSPAEAEEWFKASLPGKPYMSDITFDPERKESMFRISMPLAGGADGPGGVLSATVGTSTILSAILKISLGQTGECYLVNRNGVFLAHKEPVRILTENIAQSESFKGIFNGPSRRITYIDYRGIEVIGASIKVGGTDWTLVVEQDRDEAFRGADELRRYVFLVIALSICGAFLSAWLLSRYVADPIRKLSGAADQLARGDFDKMDLATSRADEIGLLYSAFGAMTRQLRDRQNRLEEKVSLREAELKETDVKLKRSQEAAVRLQQLASLGQLAAGVAHEIRTPLTSLKMFLESIESEFDISPEYDEDFQVAMTQVMRMESTISRFLDFARPQDPKLAQVDVGKLIEDSLLMVKPRAKQQETAVHSRIGASLPIIMGDRKQLEEVLVNIMVNALEAVGFGGKLTIVAATETLGAEPGEHVRIDIRDTGPGIKRENIPNLFDPFFTTKTTGTGLGLSIVYSIVKRHGGEVMVEANGGEGATFSVLLPVESKRIAE